MKVLLVSATKKEIKYYKNNDLEIIITGIGIPNTILNLTKKLSEATYDLVINVGICGSFKKHFKIGDVVEIINDKFSEIGYEEGSNIKEFDSSFKIINNFNVNAKTNLEHVSSITVNTVHGNKDSIKKIMTRLNPDVESMEGAAVFMVCQHYNTKCIQLRAISNYVEERNKNNWNIPLALKNLGDLLNQKIYEL